MVVASQTWELSLPGCSSLKEKRSVVRSIRDRLSSRFNVSVAETGVHDVHARAELSVALVSSDRRMAESVLDKADRFVESHGGAMIVRVRREFYT
ncbi:MAG: DUF503 domain-containing protein [Gemmatimonadota bacterium]|nr:DUF503 domain-containing protein [Gemmatimonadota bacterium]MDE3005892.1 DUF503 domain-containing protein [Gemmatimonadota bacterium]MDE3013747.1 DUF503 domain-containing protein [Gemmatimonadota bacterium]